MNRELYDKWIKSHQIEESDVDITDAVMSRITENAHQPNVLKQTWESILLDLMQTRVFVRTCVLTSGALIGLLRMCMQIYSALFV
ncbi:MAG: hypothetical protein ACYTEU_04125 [Planctomycetota bacterium]|jgi:hypothetical protein